MFCILRNLLFIINKQPSLCRAEQIITRFFHNLDFIFIFAGAQYYGALHKYLLIIFLMLDSVIVHATVCYTKVSQMKTLKV